MLKSSSSVITIRSNCLTVILVILSVLHLNISRWIRYFYKRRLLKQLNMMQTLICWITRSLYRLSAFCQESDSRVYNINIAKKERVPWPTKWNKGPGTRHFRKKGYCCCQTPLTANRGSFELNALKLLFWGVESVKRLFFGGSIRVPGRMLDACEIFVDVLLRTHFRTLSLKNQEMLFQYTGTN